MAVSTTLRRGVVAALLCVATAAPALADTTGETQYATLLRTINPHLQVHQSLAFARSLMVDAERTRLDPNLIVALVTVESHWRPDARSRVGARGLGQLMPSTAALLRVNAWDPSQNIRGAATYLRAMLDHFADRGANQLRYAIGAYNAGPKAVERYNGIPPYSETQNYVRKVLAQWRKIKVRFGPDVASVPAGITAAAIAPDRKMWAAPADATALPVSATGTPPVAPIATDAAPTASETP
jgi:soluble lytic murein transglycosylase-like protein